MNISLIIKERLNLQSTKRALESDFAIINPTFEKISSPILKQTVKAWDERKKKKFVALVGGRAYTKLTMEFLGL